jgi:hypothetical protein
MPSDWHGMNAGVIAFVILKEVPGGLAMQAAVSAVRIALMIAVATLLT